jgi:Epoxide hydrolase N terminus
MTRLETLVGLVKGNPLVLAIMKMMQGVLGVVLFTAPCYAVAPQAAGADSLASAPSATTKPAASQGTAIKPFRVNIPQAALDELRRRVRTTQWPEETVTDTSQGVPLAAMQELSRYWATRYDWRKVEAKLNALPQLITEIDGLDIHFIHVRSKHRNALPLIVNHGWPARSLSS